MKVDKINPKTVYSIPESYTQTVKIRDVGSLVIISGQVATDINGDVVGVGDIEKQVEQVYRNLEANLEAAGASFKDVVKINTYALDIEGLREASRRIRKKYFGDVRPPASTLVEVKRLARPEFLVEIEAIEAIE